MTYSSCSEYPADDTVAFTAEICGSVSNVTTYSERQYIQDAYSVTAADALGNETVSHFRTDGTPCRAEGAAYPAATALNADGRRSELRIWRDESGQPDITRWHHDQASGLVTNKVCADCKGPSYTCAADGKLASRTWARGATAAYAHTDSADGSLKTVTYSRTTPDITNRCDLTNRLMAVDDGAGSRTLSCDVKSILRPFVRVRDE